MDHLMFVREVRPNPHTLSRATMAPKRGNNHKARRWRVLRVDAWNILSLLEDHRLPCVSGAEKAKDGKRGVVQDEETW